jgi:hypothetical protein
MTAEMRETIQAIELGDFDHSQDPERDVSVNGIRFTQEQSSLLLHHIRPERDVSVNGIRFTQEQSSLLLHHIRNPLQVLAFGDATTPEARAEAIKRLTNLANAIEHAADGEAR